MAAAEHDEAFAKELRRMATIVKSKRIDLRSHFFDEDKGRTGAVPLQYVLNTMDMYSLCNFTTQALLQADYLWSVPRQKTLSSMPLTATIVGKVGSGGQAWVDYNKFCSTLQMCTRHPAPDTVSWLKAVVAAGPQAGRQPEHQQEPELIAPCAMNRQQRECSAASEDTLSHWERYALKQMLKQEAGTDHHLSAQALADCAARMSAFGRVAVSTPSADFCHMTALSTSCDNSGLAPSGTAEQHSRCVLAALASALELPGGKPVKWTAFYLAACDPQTLRWGYLPRGEALARARKLFAECELLQVQLLAPGMSGSTASATSLTAAIATKVQQATRLQQLAAHDIADGSADGASGSGSGSDGVGSGNSGHGNGECHSPEGAPRCKQCVSAQPMAPGVRTHAQEATTRRRMDFVHTTKFTRQGLSIHEADAGTVLRKGPGKHGAGRQLGLKDEAWERYLVAVESLVPLRAMHKVVVVGGHGGHSK